MEPDPTVDAETPHPPTQDAPGRRGLDGCAVVLILFLGFDICAACGGAIWLLTLCLPLWGAILLGIPLGLLAVLLGARLMFATGSVDSMDIVVHHVVIIVLVIIWVPVFSQARAKARCVTCLQNLRSLGGAVLMYTEDWDNTFPPAAHWGDAALSSLQKNQLPNNRRDDVGAIFRCPDASSAYSYGFNTSLDRRQQPVPLIAEQTVLLFEANGISRNAAGDRSLTARPPRHSCANNYVFADGHVKSVKDDTALQWTVSRAPSGGTASDQ